MWWASCSCKLNALDFGRDDYETEFYRDGGETAVPHFFLDNFSGSARLHRFYWGKSAALAEPDWPGCVAIGKSGHTPYSTDYLAGSRNHCSALAGGVKTVVATAIIINKSRKQINGGPLCAQSPNRFSNNETSPLTHDYSLWGIINTSVLILGHLREDRTGVADYSIHQFGTGLFRMTCKQGK